MALTENARLSTRPPASETAEVAQPCIHTLCPRHHSPPPRPHCTPHPDPSRYQAHFPPSSKAVPGVLSRLTVRKAAGAQMGWGGEKNSTSHFSRHCHCQSLHGPGPLGEASPTVPAPAHLQGPHVASLGQKLLFPISASPEAPGWAPPKQLGLCQCCRCDSAAVRLVGTEITLQLGNQGREGTFPGHHHFVSVFTLCTGTQCVDLKLVSCNCTKKKEKNINEHCVWSQCVFFGVKLFLLFIREYRNVEDCDVKCVSHCGGLQYENTE